MVVVLLRMSSDQTLNIPPALYILDLKLSSTKTKLVGEDETHER